MLATGTLERTITLPSGDIADISRFAGLPSQSPKKPLLPGFMEQYLASQWGPEWPEIVGRGNYVLETFDRQQSEYDESRGHNRRPAVDKRDIWFCSIEDGNHTFEVWGWNYCPQDGGISKSKVVVGPNLVIYEERLGFV